MPSMLATLGHSYLRHFPIEKGKWRVSAFLRERLGASQAPVRAAVAPKLVMDLDLTDFVQRSIYLDPSYDADLQRVISDHLPEGGVFMDIGANVGFFTLLAARRVGKGGQVHAFEPEPRTYAALRRNIALNRLTNVTAWQLALSDTAGTATLFPHAGGNSGAASLRPLENSGPPVAVELDTYDRLAAERGLPVPSLIKIDVEGAETKVIRGMTQLLSQETKPPIDPGALVPWMAYSPPDRVSAAAPIGLRGEPPGMTSGRRGLSRRTSSGGAQAGRTYFPSIWALPVHALPRRPTPTG